MAPGDESVDHGQAVSREVEKYGPISARANSRRYHQSDSSYALPTTKVTRERDRLDKLHLMFKLALGRNVLAPVPNDVTHIIDIGAGSGRAHFERFNIRYLGNGSC